ncbi:hypothetical protein ABEB36_012283 [Hypothenemus hampei]|uniref:Peptidase S1 domain-containing protein n=1 Tax=Hypothenemus hampei TaxID=57062 RepID=A0ABD1EB01_HYPHA
MVRLVLLLFLIPAEKSFSLTTGITPDGDTYLCLPNGIPCPTLNNDENTINPRIVTPLNCPTNYYSCYGKPTPCGERMTKEVNLSDGYSDAGAHPWQAFLKNSTHVFSGSGALIDQFHVLTAAHKVEALKDKPMELTVHMGVWEPNNLEFAQTTSVQEILIHPSFNKESLLNDIAVLRLEHPIVMGVQPNVNTICLPNFGTNFIGAQCIVTGWGQSAFNIYDAPTNPQKQVNVAVIPPEKCRTSFARPTVLGTNVDMYLDQMGELCAGGEAQKDACTEDGGSPLTCTRDGKFWVVGLVIWGKNCGQPGVYGVYVNISYYANWIGTTLNSLKSKYDRK